MTDTNSASSDSESSAQSVSSRAGSPEPALGPTGAAEDALSDGSGGAEAENPAPPSEPALSTAEEDQPLGCSDWMHLISSRDGDTDVNIAWE
ncbi:hypothetical protein MMYC01_203739 [Madurella mycetomatis]|uniref:Uncharacterized protein n=1 Tax=Madurella mycetomatis TaxID=100816 RepID=A0A175W8X8_9PEZI|nr:hypothetical protein MMYC01_203739 [Madurella mycetomatis]